MPNRPEIVLGFLPLLDSAILIAALEKGFAGDEGLKLTLVRENSWEKIREAVGAGRSHGAHMPAPMPIACNLAMVPMEVPLVAPMALGLGGNAITISASLHRRMIEAGMMPNLDPRRAGDALKAVVDDRRQTGKPRLRFAVAHRLSCCHYELKYWLAACGIDPVVDVEIVALPAGLIGDALEQGNLDGCCLAEPWNSRIVARDQGRIVTLKSSLWASSPGKVLGMSQRWSEDNRRELEGLLRALYRAAQWCANTENIEELAGILAARQYLALDGELLLPGLTGLLPVAPDHVVEVGDVLLFEGRAATFPWQSHALWFYSQMVRWADCRHTPLAMAVARDSYRPDIYRQALKPVFAPLPGANLKVEGALASPQYVGVSRGRLVLGPDGFFDGKTFDPDRFEDYLAAQATG
ncbi:MAG: nitrate transporter [Shinella sp.]|nr:MAG: nitrate transporter [Shinella sp.]